MKSRFIFFACSLLLGVASIGTGTSARGQSPGIISSKSTPGKVDEVILNGGDVVEVSGKGVKSIPLDKAPPQLRKALSDDGWSRR
jgi:hypothetical protein